MQLAGMTDRTSLIKLTMSWLLLVLFAWPGTQLDADDSATSDSTGEAAAVPLGDALASVNGVLIQREAFERNFARVAALSRAASAQALALDVLHAMIDQELIIQYAEETQIVVPDAAVDAELQLLKEGVGAASWDEWLAQNAYTEAEIRHAISLQLLNTAVRNAVTMELNEPVEHVRARHILVGSAAQAEYVLARLEANVSFDALAAALSQDVTTRDAGGDLSWFARGELLEERLAEAAFALEDGEIAGPVATRLGFHILQRLGSELRLVDELRRPLIAGNRFDLWLDAQSEAAEIVFNLELLDQLGG